VRLQLAARRFACSISSFDVMNTLPFAAQLAEPHYEEQRPLTAAPRLISEGTFFSVQQSFAADKQLSSPPPIQGCMLRVLNTPSRILHRGRLCQRAPAERSLKTAYSHYRSNRISASGPPHHGPDVNAKKNKKNRFEPRKYLKTKESPSKITRRIRRFWCRIRQKSCRNRDFPPTSPGAFYPYDRYGCPANPYSR